MSQFDGYDKMIVAVLISTKHSNWKKSPVVKSLIKKRLSQINQIYPATILTRSITVKMEQIL